MLSGIGRVNMHHPAVRDYLGLRHLHRYSHLPLSGHPGVYLHDPHLMTVRPSEADCAGFLQLALSFHGSGKHGQIGRLWSHVQPGFRPCTNNDTTPSSNEHFPISTEICWRRSQFPSQPCTGGCGWGCGCNSLPPQDLGRQSSSPHQPEAQPSTIGCC